MHREFADGQVVPGTRYRVVRLVGAGGMGAVYEVEHLELGKRFMLKALLRELAARRDLEQRMKNEWRALARLEHPNIVNVTDAGTSDTGVPYYVMERLEGETLSERLRVARRLLVPDALAIASSVLKGLHAAHEIGVVHRDVKPANIFLTADGAVKLLDFGVAKIGHAASHGITARGVAVGTPRYMSPEQAQGDAIDARADLYAVGLIAYEMIGGKGPFDHVEDANALLLAHMGEKPLSLRERVAAVTPDLDALIARLLAKAPAERPASARDVAAAFDVIAARFRGGAPLEAATPVAGYDAPTPAVDPATLPATPGSLSANTEIADWSGAVTRADAPLGRAGTALTVPGSPVGVSTRPDAPGARGVVAGTTTIPEPPAWADEGASVRPSSPGRASGAGGTLRLDALTPAPGEPGATRTSVPVVEPSLETPPPVESSPPEAPRRRRSPLGAVAALAALAFGAAAVGAGLVVLAWPDGGSAEVRPAERGAPEAALQLGAPAAAPGAAPSAPPGRATGGTAPGTSAPDGLAASPERLLGADGGAHRPAGRPAVVGAGRAAQAARPAAGSTVPVPSPRPERPAAAGLPASGL